MTKIMWEDEDSGFDEFDDKNPSDSDDFEKLLAGEKTTFAESYRTGDNLKAPILSIGQDNTIIDVSSKQVGIIATSELDDSEKQIGTLIDAFVIGRNEEGLLLSKSMSEHLSAGSNLESAFHNKVPIKGKVTGKNKGGFEVSFGKIKAFCPISKIDMKFVSNPDDYLNQSFDFLVEKYQGRDVVVSRMALLQKEAEVLKEKIFADFEADPGKVYAADVTKIMDFGVFCDLGGVEGLVHVSEISHGRFKSIEEILHVGDKVRCRILKIDHSGANSKLSLSIKAVSQDPWTDVSENFSPGSTYSGKVAKLEPYGAFIELAPGIDGFCHISEMSWTKKFRHPKEVLHVGQAASVRILNIDEDKRRISLTLKSLEDNPWQDAHSKLKVGTKHFAKLTKLKPFGAIMELYEGVDGLVPLAQIQKAFGDGYRKHAQPGLEVEVLVSELDLDKQKVRLSLAGLEDDSADDAAYREYLADKQQTANQPNEQNKMGSLGELLAQKLGKS